MVERVAMLCLHTSPLDQPGTGSSGGMNVYVSGLARALATADIEVDIFTRSPDQLHMISEAPNVRVIALPGGPAGPLAKDTLALVAPEYAAAIDRLAAGEGRLYDIVHSHYWISGLAGVQLADRWSVPFVHMFHTLSRVKTRFAGSPADPRRAAGEQRVLDAADAVVVANQIEATHLRESYRV
ncbi:MAG TPA: glycosyltransferase, partial [Chloroflexota bacterium]|nr:glycosyltransferase [Chloroflexota bacterium]